MFRGQARQTPPGMVHTTLAVSEALIADRAWDGPAPRFSTRRIFFTGEHCRVERRLLIFGFEALATTCTVIFASRMYLF